MSNCLKLIVILLVTLSLSSDKRSNEFEFTITKSNYGTNYEQENRLAVESALQNVLGKHKSVEQWSYSSKDYQIFKITVILNEKSSITTSEMQAIHHEIVDNLSMHESPDT